MKTMGFNGFIAAEVTQVPFGGPDTEIRLIADVDMEVDLAKLQCVAIPGDPGNLYAQPQELFNAAMRHMGIVQINPKGTGKLLRGATNDGSIPFSAFSPSRGIAKRFPFKPVQLGSDEEIVITVRNSAVGGAGQQHWVAIGAPARILQGDCPAGAKLPKIEEYGGLYGQALPAPDESVNPFVGPGPGAADLRLSPEVDGIIPLGQLSLSGVLGPAPTLQVDQLGVPTPTQVYSGRHDVGPWIVCNSMQDVDSRQYIRGKDTSGNRGKGSAIGLPNAFLGTADHYFARLPNIFLARNNTVELTVTNYMNQEFVACAAAPFYPTDAKGAPRLPDRYC